jgi:hypothetical protein
MLVFDLYAIFSTFNIINGYQFSLGLAGAS